MKTFTVRLYSDFFAVFFIAQSHRSYTQSLGLFRVCCWVKVVLACRQAVSTYRQSLEFNTRTQVGRYLLTSAALYFLTNREIIIE